jgi:hypothetical protein
VSVAFVLTRAAEAQQVSLTPGVNEGMAVSPTEATMSAPPFVNGGGYRPLGAETDLSYYDLSLATFQWQVAVIGSSVIYAYGERMTLSGDHGVVDSVTVYFNSIAQTGDSVDVLLVGDTLYNNAFHLINVFATPAPIYGSVWVYPYQVTSPTAVTVHFNHVAVPKEFFVVLISPFNQTAHSFTGFHVMGDRKPIVARTKDNSRSAFLALNTQNSTTSTSLLDTVFTDPQGHPIYSDLYITAHVQETQGGVRTPALSHEGMEVYPNPASTFIEISAPQSSGTVQAEIVDMLGRQVLSSQLAMDGKLDVRKLTPGRYEAILRTVEGNFTAPVVIER